MQTLANAPDFGSRHLTEPPTHFHKENLEHHPYSPWNIQSQVILRDQGHDQTMGTTDLPEETLLGPSEGGTVLFLAGRVGSGDGKWGVQWCEVGMDPF